VKNLLGSAVSRYGGAARADSQFHTGVGGLTLGGGMGWLARQFGLACDNVARFEVVSANGEILHASQSQNPDLFRGLRGGGVRGSGPAPVPGRRLRCGWWRRACPGGG
jgi:FAD/FMN-containing dehydrogenase